MWKSKWVIVSVALAIAVLVGGTGIALAQEGEEGSSKTLVARVAQILGIEEQTVQDAFDQAQKEMQAEALDNYLEWAVEQGKMTQEEADKYKEWWQSRPECTELREWQKARPDTPLLGRGFGHPGFKDLRGGFRGW